MVSSVLYWQVVKVTNLLSMHLFLLLSHTFNPPITRHHFIYLPKILSKLSPMQSFVWQTWWEVVSCNGNYNRTGNIVFTQLERQNSCRIFCNEFYIQSRTPKARKTAGAE